MYKHFGGKEGFWLAIIDARAEAHLHLLRQALDQVASQEDLVAALTPSNPRDAARRSRTTTEFMAAVTRLPEVAAAAVDAQRHHEEQIVALLAQHCQRLHIRPALPLPHIVVALGALSTSLALRRGVDPATDVAAIVAGVLSAVFPRPEEQ